MSPAITMPWGRCPPQWQQWWALVANPAHFDASDCRERAIAQTNNPNLVSAVRSARPGLQNLRTMPVQRPFHSVASLVAAIPDGALLALPKDESGAPCEAVREIVRQRRQRLRLLCVPACGFHADLLIGAGCVDEVEFGGIVVGELGVGQRFQAAVRAGTLRLKDSSCPALHAALQAGAKGSPFAAVRGFMGSDLLKIRTDWRVVNNPFSEAEDPVLLVPALNPDVFMFHARWADRYGNVWTGGRRDLAYTAHASRRCFVTAEEIWDGNLLADPMMAPGTLNEAYVSGVAHVPRGSWPMTLQHVHSEDTAHLGAYSARSRTDEGFAQYLDEFVFGKEVAA
jgi:glutaconate CoA-transferase subunit A